MSTAPASSAVEREVVLAVDDNEQNLQLLEEYLNTWGYEAVLARDGREAVDLYPRCNPSIIVLDVMMPNMDGYEACSMIKSSPAGRTIPVLMLTALTGTEDKIRALECGADDFLNKPINREELRTRVRSLIRIGNLRKELDSSENIIMTLTAALESKDPRTAGHVQRVAAYARDLCEMLGFNASEKEIVLKGAMLHDLGMIGVPDHLLTAVPGTEEERGRIADHTRMGASILESMVTFRQIVPIVLWHHERWDGTGYPDGLKGTEIPLEARIVAIANRFDEIRNEDRMSQEAAIGRLEAEAKSGAFDPELVAVFTASLSEGSRRAVTAKHIQPARGAKARVLCIDAEGLNREHLLSALADEQLEVHVTSGDRAVGMLERMEIDLVLVELGAATSDGVSALARIRSDPRWDHVPIIIITAHQDSTLRHEAIVSGADDFISYPLHRLELITRIRSLLRIREFHADLEQTQNIICALALTLEAKDRYTRGHSQRVGDLAYRFALHVGLGAAPAEQIRTAGLLHDIGKIAVPEQLLNKQGPLTREEFMRVIDHPVIGEEMVRPLTTLTRVLHLIRNHHERYDGRGYPDGLRGEAIPVEVRLLSIVDAYDALTSHRAYRPAPLTHQAALATLRREATGGKWDPGMVDQFAAMLGANAPAWDEIALPVPELRLA